MSDLTYFSAPKDVIIACLVEGIVEQKLNVTRAKIVREQLRSLAVSFQSLTVSVSLAMVQRLNVAENLLNSATGIAKVYAELYGELQLIVLRSTVLATRLNSIIWSIANNNPREAEAAKAAVKAYLCGGEYQTLTEALAAISMQFSQHDLITRKDEVTRLAINSSIGKFTPRFNKLD